jgi:rRNA-processing protein FCF1
MLSRDIRLSADELVIARNAMNRRRVELERRLEKTSYAGKPGMKETVLRELETVRELERSFEHGRAQLARQFAAEVLGR